jgi:hypothetical protein
VIVVTVPAHDMAEQKSQEYGAVAFLREPMKADELIATIRATPDQKD